MKIRAMLLVVMSASLCGCGTMLNLVSYEDNSDPMMSLGQQSAPKTVYGGVAIDGASGAEWINQGETLLGLYVWCVDLPLSVAGDTLTLPLTMASSLSNPIPSASSATASMSSFGKSVKSKSSNLWDSMTSFGETGDSAEEKDPDAIPILQ